MALTLTLPFPAWGAIEACLRAPLFEYNGARRISTNVLWQPPALPWITTADMNHLGYARPETKLKALRRMYFNEADAARVKALLAKREGQAFSAITLSTIAGAKDARSMGHCIQHITLSLTPNRTEATIVYRSTELIKKFSADLAFLPWILEEQLGLRVDRASFFFANCFVSGVFFPTLMRYVDPIEFLEFLRTTEHPMFIVATRFLRRAVKTKDQHFPFSPERMQHEYMWRHYPKQIPAIRGYLKEHLRGREPKINAPLEDRRPRSRVRATRRVDGE